MGGQQSKINTDILEEEIENFMQNYLLLNPKITNVIDIENKINKLNNYDKLEKYKLYKKFIIEIKKNNMTDIILINNMIDKCHLLMISSLI